MSFTWLRPTGQGGPLRTREQVAAEVHQVSLARGLDTFATVLTCMAIDVEVGADDDEGNPQWWCPSNPADPDSYAYPHDSLSDDGLSVGYLQQQKSVTGQLWWGTDASEMTLSTAANSFQERLTDDYHNADNDPHLAGQYVQNVQGSGFPARYQDHWDAAWDVVNRALAANTSPVVIVNPEPPQPVLTHPVAPVFTEHNLIGVSAISANSQPRGGTTVDLALGHTTEGSGGMDLVNYMINHEVSYHTLIDNDLDGNAVFYLVDDDRACWAVGDANNRSINYVIGRSTVEWTREQWIADARNAVRIMAWLMVQDCHRKGIGIRVIAPDPDDDTVYHSDPPGISDHKYVTEYLGWGTHSDFGPNFIWDILASDVNEFANGATTLGDDDVPTVFQPSGSIYRDSNDPLPWPGTPMDFVIDAQNNEGRIESLAIEGLPKAVALVERTASGNSPVNDSLTDDNRAQAQDILDFIAAQAKPVAKSRKVTQK